MQQMIFIAGLIACSTCFGHHYAHHQELEGIIQVVAACRIWCFGFQVVGMELRVVCPVCGQLQRAAARKPDNQPAAYRVYVYMLYLLQGSRSTAGPCKRYNIYTYTRYAAASPINITQ